MASENRIVLKIMNYILLTTGRHMKILTLIFLKKILARYAH